VLHYTSPITGVVHWASLWGRPQRWHAKGACDASQEKGRKKEWWNTHVNAVFSQWQIQITLEKPTKISTLCSEKTATFVFLHNTYNKITFITRTYLSQKNQASAALRTQYVEDIYDNPVTLKSRLTVTKGHWKRNHWVDHTRLIISRVIGRWILSWPWNVGQRSLKVTEISAIRKLGCGFLFAFYSNCGRICSRL